MESVAGNDVKPLRIKVTLTEAEGCMFFVEMSWYCTSIETWILLDSILAKFAVTKTTKNVAEELGGFRNIAESALHKAD